MTKTDLTTLDRIVLRGQSLARPCIVQQTVIALPTKHGKALTDLLHDTTVETVLIRRRLQAAGISLGETSIRRHRNGDCCCPKEG